MPIRNAQEVILTMVRWFRARDARRIEAAVESALLRGIGVDEASWPTGTDPQTIMAWIEQRLGAMRTPYGISGFQLDLFLDASPEPHATWEVATRSAWFGEPQGEVRTELERYSGTAEITIALICVGDALASTLSS
jgi:hypothetical protein